MKIFLDSNLLTYWARYEGYVAAGEYDDLLEGEPSGWQQEVRALKKLLDFHEVAGFRFAISPTILDEMSRSPSLPWELDLLQLLIEHTNDCLNEEGIDFTKDRVAETIETLRPVFRKVTNDCRAVAEAIVMDCDIFLTNDRRLAKKGDPEGRIMIMRPSEVAEMWRDHM